MVSALTQKPVKVTMTGPLMLAKVAYDEHYSDIGAMMNDFAKLLRQNFQDAHRGGMPAHPDRRAVVQPSTEEEVAAAVDAINIGIEGLTDHAHFSVHICQGNYAVGKDYDGQIGHRYFDTGRYKADLITKIECSSYLVEYDMAHHYEGLIGNKQIGIGAVDVQDPKVEEGETVAERVSSPTLGRARANDRHQYLWLQSSAASYGMR